METDDQRAGSCLPAVAVALFGAAGGTVAWALTVRARAYCDVYFDAGAMFAFNFLSPLYAGVPAVLAVLAWRLGRRPAAAITASPAGRVALRVLLVVVITVGLVWVVFAHQGTPAGEPGIGRCPASNVPPWWPGWIPA